MVSPVFVAFALRKMSPAGARLAPSPKPDQ
jgi:hypothetical protein